MYQPRVRISYDFPGRIPGKSAGRGGLSGGSSTPPAGKGRSGRRIDWPSCGWIREHHNLIVTGTTGTGKSYLACAFAEQACRSGFSVAYFRSSRLLQDLNVARGDGSYVRMLSRMAKVSLLVIDDWLINPIREPERRDLLEVFENRYERGSTLLTTQLPVKSWHEAIEEPTMADAICDRLIHRAHRIDLKGPSMREAKSPIKKGGKAG